MEDLKTNENWKRDGGNAYYRDYYWRNVETERERSRRYYQQHREERLEYKRKHNAESYTTKEGRAKVLLNNYQRMDEENGFGRDACNLTSEWIVENIFTKPCAHCGESDWHKLGCNRLDNTKPHTIDNVEPCCFECNNTLAHNEQKKKVYQYTDSGIVNEWESITECARNGYNIGHVSACCRGERKSHKGSKWSFEKPVFEKNEETWRVIKGYPCYLVSDQGRVMSLRNPKNPKILKQGTNADGYKQVTLVSGDSYGKGVRKTLRVNRLVALAFIKNEHPDKRRDVGHWDSNPANNVVNNLYWCTPAENSANPITVQRLKDSRPEAIKKTSKAVYVYDEDLHQVSAFTSTADAGRQLNTSQGNIASACAGSLPRYMGRIFSYIELTDISQREEIERSMEQQRDKNKKSMMQAVKKYYHKNKEANTEAYQKWLENAREYSRDYYYKHHDEVLIKMRERKRLERERQRGNISER